MTILNCRSPALIMNRMLCSTVSVIKRTIGEHSFQPTKPRRRCDLLGGKWLVLIRSASPAPRPAPAASETPRDRTQMSRSPMIVRSVPALRRALESLRAKKATTALVPTMGALHDGHVSLVRLANRRAAKVIVSIFVNPTQFAPSEDFGSYPRTWKADVAKLAAENVDLIWHPDVKAMYPDGFATKIVPEGPATAGLEDRFRPHFFGGVTTVVGQLFTQVRPNFAIFGEKDFQQLRVVSRMADELDLGVKVIGSRPVGGGGGRGGAL